MIYEESMTLAQLISYNYSDYLKAIFKGFNLKTFTTIKWSYYEIFRLGNRYVTFFPTLRDNYTGHLYYHIKFLFFKILATLAVRYS